MSVSLTVKYWTTPAEPNLQSYDLKVSIESATDMPSEVFVLQRGVALATEPGSEGADVFQCIADPVDLEEFPAGAPDIANEMPYYRTDTITLRFRSLSELDDVKAGIDEDLTGLVATLKAAETLAAYEEVTYA